MPFTISHAAAALPLRSLGRLRLPLAALMIGAMAPDFGYFLHLDFSRVETHSLRGILWFSLPVGLAVWLYFVAVLERPTLAFLPEAWRTRVPRSELSVRGLLFAALGIMLGAATHLAWDAFTHASTPVTGVLPLLRERVPLGGELSVRLYYLLQILSSVFGLIVLAIWAGNLRRQPPLPEQQVVPALAPSVNDFERMLALLFVGAVALAFGLLKLALDPALSRHETVFVLLIGGMTGALIGWTVLAVALRFRERTLKLLTGTRAR